MKNYPRGRRPGESRTREQIEAAARRLFAERGYDRASVRAIAAEARVDPALVTHFFGTKEQLFLAVVELPFRSEEVVARLTAGDPSSAGARLAEFVLGILEDPAGRARVTAMVRAAASEPRAAELLRAIISGEVLEPVARALGFEDAHLRASLAGSQVVGLVMARYVVRVEPLASRPAAEIAAAIAPTLQRYLTEPLS
jgi:AcrR family transcriptional regulator